MKLKTFKIQNFRGYRDEVVINFNDMTAIVGHNDVGKSTILDAMDLFFNEGKGAVSLDNDDFNISAIQNGEKYIKLTAIFTNLPNEIIIDDTNPTSLSSEYLLNQDGNLEVVKEITSTAVSGTKTTIVANHPKNAECSNLLQKKRSELQHIVDTLGVSCEDRRCDSLLRKAIWSHYEGSLDLQTTSIDVHGKDGDIKEIWDKLKYYIPQYSLFQSDRKNATNDDEVQEPLKMAVKEILNQSDIRITLDDIAERVREKLQEVSNRTLEKIREMNPELADDLHPSLPDKDLLKWPDVFKNISIAGNSDISIDKRGSGVRRLILLNFFRAEAERKLQEETTRRDSIIYAIEEPETSQHYEYQQKLLKALSDISTRSNAQVVITTHSSEVVKSLNWNDIRLVNDNTGQKEILQPQLKHLPYASLPEINYLAFGVVGIDYHNELYGYVQSKAIDENSNNEQESYFDNWLTTKGLLQSKRWIREKGGQAKPPVPCTLQTYVRNSMHHPENKNNVMYTEEELSRSIQELITLVDAIH